MRPLLSTAGELTRSYDGLSHGSVDGFGDLFSLDAVDELLSRRGLRTPFIRIAKGGAIVPASRYTRPGGVGAQIGDQVADDRVLDLFADGHTVVLQGLHRLWPPIIDFAGDLRTELGHPVQVNAYVTPRSSKGFAAHYDVHDVFVLQIAGEKRWLVHEPVLAAPLRDQPWEDHPDAVAARAAEAPLIDTVLRPGDALYLPRGFLHAAEALGDVSVHLTVGVHPVTRHAVLEEITALVLDDPELRRSLPLGVDVGDPGDIAADVEATVEALVARLGTVTVDDVARRLAARTATSGRGAPVGPLAQAAALERLDPDTVVAARRHLAHTIRDDDTGLALVLADRTVRLPAAAGKAVAALFDGAVLPVRELPGLDAGEALGLARTLLREAVVVPVESPREPGPAATRR